MDIWEWIERAQAELYETGNERLAELIELVPEYVCDNEHELVDGLVPEAIALSRAAKNEWLELFFRHWNLQSRILHRHQVKDWLPEAVALIDFGNRESTRRCPQSICVTQDLANCYANADGPAYVEERLAVARETLARIDPTWPCFTCISSEYASALIDGGRAEEAVAFLRCQIALLRQAGFDEDFRGTMVEALIRCGRYEEALEINAGAESPAQGDAYEESKAIDEARILARLGRLDEARAILPELERVLRTHSSYFGWADAAYLLARAGVVGNDGRLDSQLAALSEELRMNGVARQAFEIAVLRAKLAHERGADPADALAAARAIVPDLREPLDAWRKLDLER
jgi:tetratricopeptide (TPR) repeat protein